MAHLPIVLPRSQTAGSETLSSTAVDIIKNPGGYDVRIQRRDEPLRRFTYNFSIRRLEDSGEVERGLYELVKHYEVTEGPTHSFLLLDRTDWKSCGPFEEPSATDVVLGQGDG